MPDSDVHNGATENVNGQSSIKNAVVSVVQAIYAF